MTVMRKNYLFVQRRVTSKKGTVRLVASTFEWSEDIDVERALRAKEAAEKKIKEASDYEERAAEIKLKRALTRIRVGEEK